MSEQDEILVEATKDVFIEARTVHFLVSQMGLSDCWKNFVSMDLPKSTAWLLLHSSLVPGPVIRSPQFLIDSIKSIMNNRTVTRPPTSYPSFQFITPPTTKK